MPEEFVARIGQDAHIPCAGGNLLEKLYPSAGYFGFERAEPGDVGSRLGHAGHVAATDRIAHRHEHCWHAARRLQHGLEAHRGIGDNYIRRERDDFPCVVRRAFELPPNHRTSIWTLPPVIHPSAHSAFRKAERRACISGSRSSDASSTPMRRIRWGCCARATTGHAAAQPNSPINSRRCMVALKKTYSITRSARARIIGGIVRPSTPAVLVLITSSSFVGCSTGKSPGFAPLKILSIRPADR